MTVSKNGISGDEREIEAVKIIIVPQKQIIPEFKSFLGFATYLGSSINNFANIADPLLEIIRKKVGVEWLIFRSICKTENRVYEHKCTMVFWQGDFPTRLTLDASPFTINNFETKTKTVKKLYRMLSRVERRYSNTKKEALAVFPGL